MRIGGSLILIAIGAILTWAVTAEVDAVDLDVLGVILMIVGAAGLVISLILAAVGRKTQILHRGVDPDGRPAESSTTYVTPARPDTDPRR